MQTFPPDQVILIWLFEKAGSGKLFSVECTLTWTFIAWRRWVWLQQRIMVLMTDPSPVSLCGMQSTSVLLLWHAYIHTLTHIHHDITLCFNKSYLLSSASSLQGGFSIFFNVKSLRQTPLHSSESCFQGFIQVLTCTRKKCKQWQAGLLIVPVSLNHIT